MLESITLIVAAFLTSILSAIIGMGGGITLLGIMAIILPEGYLVVAYHGIVQLVSNVTRTTVFKDHISLNILKRFFNGIVPGLILAAVIIYALMQYYEVSSASQIKIDFLKPLIGLFIIWFLFGRRPKPKDDQSNFFGVGLVSGITTCLLYTSPSPRD